MAKRTQAQKPGPVTVVQPVGAMAQVAATLVATPAPVQPAPVAVALRGGLAVVAVALGGKPYRVTAPHNQQWWAAVQAAITAGGGTASVPALVKAGVPLPLVGYLVRRGYCTAVQPAQVA